MVSFESGMLTASIIVLEASLEIKQSGLSL